MLANQLIKHSRNVSKSSSWWRIQRIDYIITSIIFKNIFSKIILCHKRLGRSHIEVDNILGVYINVFIELIKRHRSWDEPNERLDSVAAILRHVENYRMAIQYLKSSLWAIQTLRIYTNSNTLTVCLYDFLFL